MTTYPACQREGYEVVPFSMPMAHAEISRPISPHPFVPDGAADRAARCQYILNIQAHGLKKRLAHTGAKTAVVGISGGLDSCLALLAAAHAMDRSNRLRPPHSAAGRYPPRAKQTCRRGFLQTANRTAPFSARRCADSPSGWAQTVCVPRSYSFPFRMLCRPSGVRHGQARDGLGVRQGAAHRLLIGLFQRQGKQLDKLILIALCLLLG